MPSKTKVLDALASFRNIRNGWLTDMIKGQSPNQIAAFMVKADMAQEIVAEIALSEQVEYYMREEPYSFDVLLAAAQAISKGYTSSQILKAVSSIHYYIKGNA